MGTKRFPRQTEGKSADGFSLLPQRPGFRMSCQMAGSKRWNNFHIDLKTAAFQGQSYDVNHDMVCQFPPEAGHPPYIAARPKKPAYGMKNATRRWWNILDQALCSFGIVSTQADRCCCVLYSIQPRERTWKQNYLSQWHDTSNVLTKPREQTEMDAAL